MPTSPEPQALQVPVAVHTGGWGDVPAASLPHQALHVSPLGHSNHTSLGNAMVISIWSYPWAVLLAREGWENDHCNL